MFGIEIASFFWSETNSSSLQHNDKYSNCNNLDFLHYTHIHTHLLKQAQLLAHLYETWVLWLQTELEPEYGCLVLTHALLDG